MSTTINLRAVFAFAREMHPRTVKTFIQYGTAGFRDLAEKLEHVMFRMGVLANIRSRYKNGQAIGVMITASHNPEPDNGVKLVDPMGDMLESSWEKWATKLANVPDEELESVLKEIIAEEKINMENPANVFVGMDTRYHSPVLSKAVVDGVISLKGNVREYGICTTPMLHYFVVCKNTENAYGVPTEEGYYQKLLGSYEKLRGQPSQMGNYKPTIKLDGANGVGALKMLHVSKRLRDILNITVLNCHGKINYECGADYVKVRQRVPIGVDCVPYETCVSFDGDADRIVYFFVDDNMKFNLLDGDRIATLIADYLIDSLSKFNLDLKLGIVQTAYANGASTNYIENVLKVPVACVPTGVKHLHHRAKDFDIGVYFEANGHGTILFSENAKNAFREIKENSSTSPELLIVAERMLNFIDLINETVGDALSDMLVVETILCSKGWDCKDWLASYTDLPNMQVKVKVKNRNIFETTDAERVCVKPEGLQARINEVVKKYSRARSFVRPSGTEDVVRVYAEAETKEEVKQLAFDVATLVFELADGIGDKPDIANF